MRRLYVILVAIVIAYHLSLASGAPAAGQEASTTVLRTRAELEGGPFYPPHLLANLSDVWRTQTREEHEQYWAQPQRSALDGEGEKYAFVTLLHGLALDNSHYRRYLVGLLIAKHAMEEHGSLVDYVVLVGFGSSAVSSDPRVLSDLHLLEAHGLIVRYIPGTWYGNEAVTTRAVTFLMITMSKMFAWSLIQYTRVQLIDADVMPLHNMDCFFQTNQRHVFVPESDSPINAGWILLTPNFADFLALYEFSCWRLQLQLLRIDFPARGWGPLPSDSSNIMSNMPQDWTFPGGHLEQGLLTYYFYAFKGSLAVYPHKLQVSDPRTPDPARYYIRVVDNYMGCWELQRDVFPACNDSRLHPRQAAMHFFDKPWTIPVEDRSEFVDLWYAALDALQIPGVTAETLEEYFTEFDNKGGHKKGSQKNQQQ